MRETHTLSTAPGDWQRWTEAARARGISVAEYLRRAEAAYREAQSVQEAPTITVVYQGADTPAEMATKIQEAVRRWERRGETVVTLLPSGSP